MPPLIGTAGAASARGFGLFTLTTFGPVGWILYTGLANSATAGSASVNRGFFVDASSNSYWIYTVAGTKNALIQANTDGSLTASTIPFDGPAAPCVLSAQSRTTGAGNVIVAPGQSLEVGGINRLNSSLVKQFADPKMGFNSFGTRRLSPIYKNAAVTSAGAVFVTGVLDQGKSGTAVYFLALTSSGGYSGFYIGEYSRKSTLCITTTGAPVLFLAANSSTVKWAYLTSSGAFSSGFQCSLSPASNVNTELAVQADASNNLFGVTGDGYIFRISSSNSVTHLANVSGLSGPSGEQAIACQGSSVYIMWARDAESINIMSLNSSNLTHQWTNTFTISGFPSNYNLTTVQGSLYATAGGLFLNWTARSFNESFVMKIPLTGMPSAGSKVLSGVGTLNWTRPVLTITQYTPGTTSSSTLSAWSLGSTQNTNSWPVAVPSNTATAQKTEI